MIPTAARLALACLGLAAAATAQQNQNPPFRLPDTVDMRRDLVYGTGGGRDLHLDLFLPKEGKGPFPAVLYIHGGGWAAGNKAAFQRQAAYMATKGFAGACIEYRLSGEAKFPAALYDAKAALRWMRANAAKYRINPDQIGAAGGSAGGHLVALLGTTADLKQFEGDGGNAGQSTRVSAVVVFNPALDLQAWGKARPGDLSNSVAKFLGCSYSQDPELWAAATPQTHAGKTSPPFLFLHGTADRTVPYSQSQQMLKLLQGAGVYADIFSAEGAGHGFFNRPPWFEPTLQRMAQFFTRFLK